MTPKEFKSENMARDWMEESWRLGFEFSQLLNDFENFERAV